MSEISKTQNIKIHNQSIKNQQEKQNVELEKLRLAHKTQKQELSHQQDKEILNIRTQNERELMNEALKNEKKLIQLKENLETVQKQTEKEKTNLKQNLTTKTEIQREQFQNLYNTRAEQQKLQLQDLEDTYNVEIKKLQRELKNKQRDIQQTGSENIREVKAENKDKLYSTKNLFRIKKDGLDTAHHNELVNQEERHRHYLAKQERDFHKKSIDRQEEFDGIVKKVENDGRNRQLTKQKLFEKKYNQLNSQHQRKIATLSKNKEGIINQLKNQILHEHELNFNKTRDPFYTKTTIEPQVTKLENRNFKLTLPIPKTELEHLNVVAANKNIKITFDRSFNNVIENENGTVDKINKVESITKNIKVDEVLDPKSVTRHYENGVLEINIKRA